MITTASGSEVPRSGSSIADKMGLFHALRNFSALHMCEGQLFEVAYGPLIYQFYVNSQDIAIIAIPGYTCIPIIQLSE